ncbi:MFS transporter [Nonomuraea bangladeshensis]|uniref:spinster family MFS transporter n=1 Tax=Nonomuraea bangladeshensis TaxID=404385 RepID=UPI0031E1C1AB
MPTAVNAPAERVRAYSVYVLILLMLIYCMNIADRYLASTFLEQIKAEYGLSDAQVGLLTGSGTALFFAVACIPLGRLADRASRRNLIVVSLAVWSVATTLSGFAKNTVQFLIGRFVVGAGEAGGTPASFSLLADKFPPRQRTVAMSIFTTGSSIGGMIGTLGATFVAAQFGGWRAAFVVFGLIGVPLALLMVFTVREPARGALDPTAAEVTVRDSSFIDTSRHVLKSPALFHVLAAGTVMSLWGWGLLWWLPAYLTRSAGLDAGAAGGFLGWVYGIGGTAALLLVALFLWWRKGSVASTMAVLKISTFIAMISAIAIFVVPGQSGALIATAAFACLIYCYTGPVSALLQDLSPATMRAQVFAIFTVTAAITNLLLAPYLIGSLSDWLVAGGRSAADGLRLALLVWSFLGIWAYAHYALAHRHMKRAKEASS